MEKIIRVTGEGKVNVRPDTIEVRLQITGVDKDYSKSLEIVDKKVFVLKKEFEKVGIKDENVLTQNFSIRQKYESVKRLSGGYDEVFKGYETYHALSVSFDYDTKKLGEVVSKIASTLSEPRLSIAFTVKKQEGLKAKILASAVENAKADAEALASAAGVKLGDILSINHSFGEVRYSYPRNAEFMAKCSMESESCYDGGLSNINVDDVVLEGNATIEWEIK